MSLKFCGSLSYLFDEAPSLLDRYDLARRAGFKAVECAYPYDFPIEQIVKAKEDASLKQILIHTPVDFVNQEGGYAALGPEYNQKFLQGINKAIDYAKALNCSMIHIMCGVVRSPTVNNRTYLIQNLRRVIPLLKEANITGVIGAISDLSIPDYYLNNYDKALDIVDEINSPRIRLLLDIFHLKATDERTFSMFGICKLMPYTSHIRIAQFPSRNEPNAYGVLDYEFILGLLETWPYTGYIGLAYHPFRGTVAGLYWIRHFGYSLDH